MKSPEIEKYSLSSRLLHWTVAILVIALFGLGLWMRDLDYYSSWYQTAPQLHVLLGIALVLLMVVRVGVRLKTSPPKPLAELSQMEILAAHTAHKILYFSIFVLIISGYLIVAADDEAMNILGLFDVPVFERLFENQEDIAGDIHEWSAWGLIGLATLHGAAALKHHFISKDDTLRRML